MRCSRSASTGEYPRNKLGQTEYPRKRFFDEIVAVMRRSKRFVPLFNDKHLSYRWDWAKEMADTATKLGIPFMAGSSVPLAQRIPAFELPADAAVTEAVSIHGGGIESYDFHALEVLQSIVEFRKGGETGVASVEFLDRGRALEGGRGRALVAAAGGSRDGGGVGQEADARLKRVEGEKEAEPHGILLTYKDGLRACVLKVGRSSTRWNFACTLKGDPKPHATRFHVGPWQNRNLFKALSHAIQHHFRTGKAPYPVERTLLVSGVLDAAMHSRAERRGAEDAAPGVRLRGPRLHRDARDGRELEDRDGRHAATRGDRPDRTETGQQVTGGSFRRTGFLPERK